MAADHLEPGWLDRQFRKTEEEIQYWSSAMREHVAAEAQRRGQAPPTYRQPPPEEYIPQLQEALRLARLDLASQAREVARQRERLATAATYIAALEQGRAEDAVENRALRAGVRLESCISGCAWTLDGHFRHHPWCVDRMPSVQAMKNTWELERKGLERRAVSLMLLEVAARRMVRIGARMDEAAGQHDTGRVVALVGAYQEAWQAVQAAVARLRGQSPDWPAGLVERVARAMFDAEVPPGRGSAETAWAAEGRDRGLWASRARLALRALAPEEGA